MTYPERIEWTDADGGHHSLSGPLADDFAKRMDREYPTIKYYDRQGVHIGFGVYTELTRNLDYKRIGADVVGPLWISTVWLGMDHGFPWVQDKEYRPIIFETMAFPHDEHPGTRPLSESMHAQNVGWLTMPARLRETFENEQSRYHTQDEAVRGHHKWVTKARTLLIEIARES